MKPITKTKIIAVITLIVLGLLYLGANLLILYGAQKERADRPCPSAYELEQWKNSSDFYKAICIDIQGGQLEEIKNGYHKDLETAQQDSAYWQQKHKELTEQYISSKKIN